MEKYLTSFDGTSIYYIHKKNKNPHTLVFLHGIGANWTIWRKEIEFFGKKGYSIIAPDLRGHGLSDWPHEKEKYDCLNFVKDLDLILKTEKLKDFTLVGHSLGGMISMDYCNRFKKLPDSLVLLDTAHRFPYKLKHEFNLSPIIVHILRWLAEHEDIRNTHFPHFADKNKELKNFKGKYEYLFKLFYHTPLKCVFKCIDSFHEYSDKHRFEIESSLQNLNMPTLIITASKDRIVPPSFSEELHKLIKRSEFKILKGAHHLVQVERPDEVNKNMIRFFKEHKI